MEITWIGRTCFRLRGREGAILTDPVAAETGHSLGRTSAEIVTLSRRDDLAISNVKGVSGEPRVFDAPGEYEVRGILVTGFALALDGGGQNMVFACEIDGINIVHLGLPDAPPAASVLEQLDDVDVLLMPVGAGTSLSASVASDVMQTIDPHLVVPMNYKTEQEQADLEPLSRFLSEAGVSPEPLPKLSVTRGSIPAELSIEVLEPRGT